MPILVQPVQALGGEKSVPGFHPGRNRLARKLEITGHLQQDHDDGCHDVASGYRPLQFCHGLKLEALFLVNLMGATGAEHAAAGEFGRRAATGPVLGGIGYGSHFGTEGQV